MFSMCLNVPGKRRKETKTTHTNTNHCYTSKTLPSEGISVTRLLADSFLQGPYNTSEADLTRLHQTKKLAIASSNESNEKNMGLLFIYSIHFCIRGNFSLPRQSTRRRKEFRFQLDWICFFTALEIRG